jgi:hypothetical protein
MVGHHRTGQQRRGQQQMQQPKAFLVSENDDSGR